MKSRRLDAGDFYDYQLDHWLRPNQDIDIVIDGPREKAEKLQATLETAYKRMQGNRKSAWEVRPLRDTIGNKEALLNNPDVLNQHSDSMSNGLIEITAPLAGEPRISEIRPAPKGHGQGFLQDAARGEIHYYFSGLHSTTQRAINGDNPPIISALRVLAKTFQYGLILSTEDRNKIRTVVTEFDPQSDYTPYATTRIYFEAKKVLLNSRDLEAAWNELESLGLRSKLVAFDGPATSIDSLAWWLSREPLRSRSLGTQGRTASELGLSRVSHETRDILTYLNWQADPSELPNVFISREGAPGERAEYGDGFYVAVGDRGAAIDGFPLRLELLPEAREGADFLWIEAPEKSSVVEQGDFILILNRSALRRLPEPLEINPVALIKRWSSTPPNAAPGVMARIIDRVRSASISAEAQREIRSLLSEQMKPNAALLLSAISMATQIDPQWDAPRMALDGYISEIKKEKREEVIRAKLEALAQWIPYLPNVIDRFLQLVEEGSVPGLHSPILRVLQRLGPSRIDPYAEQLVSAFRKQGKLSARFPQSRDHHSTFRSFSKTIESLAKKSPAFKEPLLSVLKDPDLPTDIAHDTLAALGAYSGDTLVRRQLRLTLEATLKRRGHAAFSEQRPSGVGASIWYVFSALGPVGPDEPELQELMIQAVKTDSPAAESALDLLARGGTSGETWISTLLEVVRSRISDPPNRDARTYSTGSILRAATELGRHHRYIEVARTRLLEMRESTRDFPFEQERIDKALETLDPSHATPECLRNALAKR